MASNSLSLEDEDGDDLDWIEIHNPDGEVVDLDGWHLTDDPKDLRKWSLPSPTRIAPLGYAVVFATGKDRAISGKELHTNFKLSSSGEYLALVDKDGKVVSDHGSNYPPQFKDISYGFVFASGKSEKRVYLENATPGAPNTLGAPVFDSVSHSPASLGTATDTVITANVRRFDKAVIAGVSLKFRIDHSPELEVPMRDDGRTPDAVAGDWKWTANIPNSHYELGQMLRWRVEVSSAEGSRRRAPLFLSETNSPEYFGTIVQDPGIKSSIPIFHWWTADPRAAAAPRGARCSVYFEGEFYDNVFVRNRGATSRDFPKQSFKFDFNKGHHFRFHPDEERVEEINLNTTYADKAYIRQILAYETLRDAGAEYSVTFPLRQQLNGEFFMVSIFTEQVDQDYLRRQSLDPTGALYKVFNVLISASPRLYEKKTRRKENWRDLRSLVNRLRLRSGARESFLWDNVDIPACINYWACIVIMHDNDCIYKNYYLYRDTNGDREWRFLPWDKDLVFGRNYTTSLLNDTIWAEHDPQSHPLFGDRNHRKIDGKFNLLIDALLSTPRIREMYLRRLRTLMDRLLNDPSTAISERYYERRIDELQSQMTVEVELDHGKWGRPWYGDHGQDFPSAIEALKGDYLVRRRRHLFLTHSAEPGGIIPQTQPTKDLALRFGGFEMTQDPDNARQDYVEIVNRNGFAVDISGWQLKGAGIEFSFSPGTVLATEGSTYVAANPAAFRKRNSSPKGGENRFVVGPFRRTKETQTNLVLFDDSGHPILESEIP